MSQAETILRDCSTLVNDFLKSIQHCYVWAPSKLVEAIQYSLLAGGKRLRPTLVLESARAIAGAKPDRTVITAAGAIEMIHTFSLVHDDLPAMDNDDLRRGKPTNHKVFGEATAILAGDAMMTMAFELLTTLEDGALGARLIAELARAAGPDGMIGGQVLDIDGENRSLTLTELQHVHKLKTGALLRAACRIGAICGRANPDQFQQLTYFGQHLGLAFQIVDDILDVTSTPEEMGKATKKDAQRGKNTYPALMGLDASKAEAQKQVDAAVESLRFFGPSADGLRAIARFVTDRKS
jgi:geranylgeranyl diphosphate synthase type II